MVKLNGTRYSETLEGTAGDDTIKGRGGEDVVYGYDGNDRLFGGSGSDSLFGGSGNDRLLPGPKDGSISLDWLYPGSGRDVVDFARAGTGMGGYRINHFEVLDGLDVMIDSVSNTGVIRKGDQGSTKLVDVGNALQAGQDGRGLWIDGTPGDDSYDIRLKDGDRLRINPLIGEDTFFLRSTVGEITLDYSRFSQLPWDLHANLDTGEISYFDGTEDKVTTIEGPGYVSRFVGSSQNDIIVGSAETSEIHADEGRDTIIPHNNDVDLFIDVGSGSNLVDFSQISLGNAQYTISVGSSLRLEYHLTEDAPSRYIAGDGLASIIDVSAAMAVPAGTIDGGLKLPGTLGDDLYYLSLQRDEVLFIDECGGEDTIRIDFNRGYLFLSYRHEETGIRADLRNGLVVSEAGETDTISGPGHVNELWGSVHSDRIKGSGRDEVFKTFGGNDTVDGRHGLDTVSYGETGLGVRNLKVDLEKGTASLIIDGMQSVDRLLNIENVTGSEKGDILRGDGGANVLHGLGGGDRLVGRPGRDELIGGAGNDELVGGLGRDLFVFGNANGHDVIQDFDHGLNGEKIDLSDVSRIRNFRDLVRDHIAQDGPDVLIDDGARTQIVLSDVTLAELDRGDFIF